MPQAPHIEKHFTSGNLVRDIVIGMSDGLTVPFALAAGISGGSGINRNCRDGGTCRGCGWRNRHGSGRLSRLTQRH